MLVQIMTERVSGTNTQDDPSQNSDSTPKPVGSEDQILTPKTTHLPSHPVPHIKKDGFIRMRIGRPRNSHRQFRETSQYYDLRFPTGGRRYKVTFTSRSVPEVAFEREFLTTSLRTLLTEVAYFIGTTRKPKAARHFTVTFEAYPDDVKMVDANVGIPFGEPLEADDRPTTVLPSLDEDLTL
jgi:hypothetical protein